ncbi:MAG: RsmB/NOP family class I SAM-dependent RNA methyltransferase [Pseudomonadota bacterium]
MTPAARYAAAIEVLDEIAEGQAAEAALLRWTRAHRFAGSKDRAAIRDIVFSIERRRASCAAMGGGQTGRSLVLGYLAQEGQAAETVFGADRYAPLPLEPGEEARDGSLLSEAEKADLQPWIWTRFQEDYGAQAGAVAEALRHRAPVWLRVNRAKAQRGAVVAQLAADGFAPEAHESCSTAIRINAGARQLAQHSLYLEGLVELQDLGSQIAMEALEIAQGSRVLDFCAGGGGKALAAAAQGAQVTAHDAMPARMGDLPTRAARAGAEIDLAPPRGAYDYVICDVPCSGSGAWRRSPSGKWQLGPDDLARLVALQRSIVREALGFLRPGGCLAYMTCSLLQVENRDQRDFLLDASVSGAQLSLLRDAQLTPLDGSDGFYYAVFESEHPATSG